jgi:Zn-dependent protease/CBS domain-containing protein
MKWSWKLGTFARIDVFVHATFLLLIGWIGLTYWLQRGSVQATVEGVAFILALFVCVLLHEYGHALAARKYGIQTKDITLLPIGGVARLERMPDEPRQELWVALAGPAVNLVIASVLLLWLTISGFEPVSQLTVASGSFVERLLIANVFLVAFNLLPAFPMDGGRVVRALLATRLEYTRATQFAATLGQGMALLFGLAGLFLNPFLLFIALFVWIGAAQEASATQMKFALAGIPLERAMITDFRALAPGDPISRAVELMLSGWQQDFPVSENGRVVGILPRSELLVALSRHAETHPVADVMRRDFHEADSSDMLATVFERLQEGQCHTIPVVRNGRLVGLATMENVGEYMMIQSALSGRGPLPALAKS